MKTFKDWKLANKIFAISLANLFLLSAVIIGLLVPKVGEYIYSEKKETVKDIVEVVNSLVTGYEAKVNKGILTEVEAQEQAANAIKQIRYAGDNYLWINNMDTVMVMHPLKPKLDGTRLDSVKDPNGVFLFQEFVKICKENGSGFVHYMWAKPGFDKPMPKISYVKEFKPWGWVIGTGIYIDDVDTIVQDVRKWVFMLTGVFTMISLGITVLVAGQIVKPVKLGVEFANKMAAGDLTQVLDLNRKDEIGILIAAVNKMGRSFQGMFKEVNNGVNQLSQSSSQLSNISDDMLAGAQKTSEKSTEVTVSAEDVSDNMNAVAAATEEASTNISMVAAAAEELTATVNEISGNSENACTITAKAVAQAKSASQKVDTLGKSAFEISKVTEVITEISEQTNLLALNATIEAARAGEAGKGFAVVANEIKDLSRQTADATTEIRNKIEMIQASTNTTVEEINQISEVINKANDIVSSIAATVEEQAAATQEIAGNVMQASEGIKDVTENVVKSSTASSEIAQEIKDVDLAANKITVSSGDVKSSAEDLANLAVGLTNRLSQYKA